jgi:hypothetical protein
MEKAKELIGTVLGSAKISPKNKRPNTTPKDSKNLKFFITACNHKIE